MWLNALLFNKRFLAYFWKMKERVSKLTYPHASTLLENASNGNSKHSWRAILQKASFIWVAQNNSKSDLLREKNEIYIFHGYAQRGMSFTSTKFQETLLSSFRGVALTNCFSSIFHFVQISKFKKGVKNWIKFPVDMSIYTLCPS